MTQEWRNGAEQSAAEFTVELDLELWSKTLRSEQSSRVPLTFNFQIVLVAIDFFTQG